LPVLFAGSSVESETGSEPRFILSGKDLREITAAEEEIRKLQVENVYLQEEIKAGSNFEAMVGSSPAMRAVFRKIEQVASTDAIVLLRGDTGTGKELVARALHNLGGRREKPLIKVDCASLSAGLVESELFGHEKGAFTGATGQRLGRFELAHKGTIFLDEIGELPHEAQVKLLRVLQEQEFERVGGSQTVAVDVRIIAATNRNLEAEVRAGVFREDLYYRLNVFPIELPPLRERLEDIPLLVQFFVDRFSRKAAKAITGVSDAAMARLKAYAWPGNVRELANVLERAIIVCEGRTLDEVDLQVLHAPEERSFAAKTLDEVEKRHIEQVLRECNGVIEGPGGAAKRLGLHPATLRSRMRKLGVERQGRLLGDHAPP